MIRFVIKGKPHIKVTGIPFARNKKIVYLLYCDEHLVGETHGNSNGVIVIDMLGQGAFSYSEQELRKIMNSNISFTDFVNGGTVVQ